MKMILRVILHLHKKTPKANYATTDSQNELIDCEGDIYADKITVAVICYKPYQCVLISFLWLKAVFIKEWW